DEISADDKKHLHAKPAVGDHRPERVAPRDLRKMRLSMQDRVAEQDEADRDGSQAVERGDAMLSGCRNRDAALVRRNDFSDCGHQSISMGEYSAPATLSAYFGRKCTGFDSQRGSKGHRNCCPDGYPIQEPIMPLPGMPQGHRDALNAQLQTL